VKRRRPPIYWCDLNGEPLRRKGWKLRLTQAEIREIRRLWVDHADVRTSEKAEA
jgi:hypothetical protein